MLRNTAVELLLYVGLEGLPDPQRVRYAVTESEEDRSLQASSSSRRMLKPGLKDVDE